MPHHDSSPSALRADSMESISSMKMTAGCRHSATVNSARTIFSPSPILCQTNGRFTHPGAWLETAELSSQCMWL